MSLILKNGLPYSIFLTFQDLRELEIETEQTHCNNCESKTPLRKQWSNHQNPLTISLGNVDIRVIVKYCPDCKTKYPAEQYRNLIPLNGIYGYDVIRKVGNLRYSRGLQDIEIQRKILTEDQIAIPLSSISHLAKKDIDYISAVHYASADILKENFAKNGLILHMDGTYEGDSGIHFSMRDSVSNIVLYNLKIKSENEKDITNAINECVKYFGKPSAVVCDLSSNIMKAAKNALEDTPLLICHYHFLENLGTALLKKNKNELSKIIKQSKLRSYLQDTRKNFSRVIKKHQEEIGETLAKGEEEFTKALRSGNKGNIDKKQYIRYLSLYYLQWIADFKYELKGEYFPFSIRELAFVEKCEECLKNLQKLLSKKDKQKKAGSIFTIYKRLNEFINKQALVSCKKELTNGVKIFNEARDFFRLNSSLDKPILRQKVEMKNNNIIKNFEEKMIAYKAKLNKKMKKEDITMYAQIVIGYINKYEKHLTGHVLIHSYKGEEKILSVPRTNNIMETLFGIFKRKMRKKIGCKRLTNHFKGMHPDEFLVENLNNELYIALLYGGNINNLISEYPKHDQKAKKIQEQRKEDKGSHKIKKTTLRDKYFSNYIFKAIKNFLKSA